jgi:hypothetical protein
MGGQPRGSLNWSEEERNFVTEYIANTKNPKLVRFWEYSFPVTNPVEMKVRDSESQNTLKLQNYCYPAYHDLKESD